MKKLLMTLSICALALVCIFTLPTRAEAASIDDLRFDLNDDGESYSITHCDSSATGELVIPATYEGKPVTSIDRVAFYDCASLTSVTIPDSVTTIGYGAFLCCTNLTSVTIPDSVTTIGDSAFNDCASLTAVTIGDSVTTIGDSAFSDCASLTSVTIPDSVKSIGNEAFYCCFSLTDLTIGNSVTTIGHSAFYCCKSLTDLTIGNSVTTIGYSAFGGCSSLTEVTIPDSVTAIDNEVFAYCTSLTDLTIGNSVTTIGDNAFYYCTSLTDLTIGDSVESIGRYAFYSCDSLTSVTIPDSVTTIGEKVFASCSSLTEVTIPDSVTTIGEKVFASCASLTSVTIPDSVTAIGRGAFDGCSSLTNVYITDIAAWCQIDFGGYWHDYGINLFENGVLVRNLVIPDSVTAIGDYAFYSCSSLTSITIPDSVKSIGYSAFSGCDSLTSITIPDSVTTIGNSAFGSCDSMTSVTIGDSVTTIGDEAFAYCSSLTSVTIGDSVTSIGECAFYLCDSLTSITIPTSVTTIGKIAFFNFRKVSIYYGASAEQWNKIKTAENIGDVIIHYNHIHDYSLVKPVTVKATCTQKGYVEYTCVYGEKHREYTPALGHDYTGAVKTVAPTCTKDGVTGPSCIRCKDIRPDKTSSALGHNMVKVNAKAATCTKAGNDVGTQCSRCKAYGIQPKIYPALGHSYKSGVCTRCKNKPAGAKITTQPVNVAVASGKTAKVTVKATGDGLKYQWYYAKKGSSKYTKDSVTSASYSVKMSSSVDGRKVYCVVTDQYGNSVKSNVVTLYKGTPAKITTQPKSITVANGKTGKLELKASGSSLKYQWYVKYKGASSFTKVGSSSKTYSFKMASKLNGAQAYCVVKDKYGIEVKSSVVTIKMPVQPKITTQPKSVTQVSGKTVKFSVKASGDGLKYQWYYAKKGSNSFKKLSGATKATYSVKVSSSVNGRKYYCLVTDKYGQTVKSSAVTLTMKTVAKITTQPKSVTVANGKTAKVTIKAVGDGLKYTWYYLQPGATKYVKATSTGASYSVKMAAAWKNAKVYCVIADKYGNTVKSNIVTLKMK